MYEDESHVILVCPRYQAYRKFLPRRLKENPDMLTLVGVFNSSHKVELNMLANFLKKISPLVYDQYKREMIPRIRRRRSLGEVREVTRVDLNSSHVQGTHSDIVQVVLENSFSD